REHRVDRLLRGGEGFSVVRVVARLGVDVPGVARDLGDVGNGAVEDRPGERNTAPGKRAAASGEIGRAAREIDAREIDSGEVGAREIMIAVRRRGVATCYDEKQRYASHH